MCLSTSLYPLKWILYDELNDIVRLELKQNYCSGLD